MNLAEYLINTILKIGVDTMFCVPGSAGLKLLDATWNSKLKVVLNRHENSAAFAADGYSRMKQGIPGVYFATNGPGLTNSITGLSTGTQDYSRLLSISPQHPKRIWGKGAVQDTSGMNNFIDSNKLLEATTKYYLSMEAAEDFKKIPDVFNNLISGVPGSVGLSVCADLWDQDADMLSEYEYKEEKQIYEFDKHKLADIINETSMNEALVVIGYGAVISPGAKEKILEFLKKTNFPYITTLKAKGFISEDHPQFRGVGGLYGHTGANKLLLRKNRLLITFGVSFSEFFSHTWDKRISNSKYFIRIDIDKGKERANYNANIPVTSDVSFFLNELLPLIYTNKRLENKDEQNLIHGTMPKFNKRTVQPQYFLQSLSELLPKNAAVFCDIGCVATWVEAYLSILQDQKFFIAPSFASMGYSIPAAIGGKIARPDLPVFSICGDGGFYMTGMELLTAKQYNVPITVIVFDNGRLDMMHVSQKHLLNKHYVASDFKQALNFELFAKASGVEYLKVESMANLRSLINKAPVNKHPLLIHVPVDTDEEPPIKPRMIAAIRSMGMKAPKSIKELPSLLKIIKEK